jgi:hypothetical protein
MGLPLENKIENNEDPKLHMVERDVVLLKEMFVEIIRLMEKVLAPKIATNVYGSCKKQGWWPIRVTQKKQIQELETCNLY